MKKAYLSPETLIISLESKDVLCTSVDEGQPDEEDPGFGLISMGFYWNAK